MFEQDGDLMSSAQEISSLKVIGFSTTTNLIQSNNFFQNSYKTDMVVSLPSNNLSPISATYNQRHEKLRLL